MSERDLFGERPSGRLSPSGWVGQRWGAPWNRNLSWTSPHFPGVVIRHCGHPTALRPYYTNVTPGTFARLRDAQEAVAAHFRERNRA